MNQSPVIESVTVNGQVYSPADIQSLASSGEIGKKSLRDIARWLAKNERLHGLTWIGGLGKDDLVAYILFQPLSKPVIKADGYSVDTSYPGAERFQAEPTVTAPSQPVASQPVGDNGLLEALQTFVQSVSGKVSGKVDLSQLEERLNTFRGEIEESLTGVQDLLDARIEAALQDSTRVIEIRVNGEVVVHSRDVRHVDYDDLLADIIAFEQAGHNARANFWLTGEAGTGKTTAARHIAEDLGRAFYFNGAIDSEYKLRGFVDANGRIIDTAFRHAYTYGGVYLFDEVDSSLPAACLAFNAALANGCYDFPGETLPTPRHPNFVCIAAGNTMHGPTGDYCGRYKQDAAFMDRFMQVDWQTDERLEGKLCSCKAWHRLVKQVRRNAAKHDVSHIVSPRATLNGDTLIGTGRPWARAVKTCIRKRLNDEDWKKLTDGIDEALLNGTDQNA